MKNLLFLSLFLAVQLCCAQTAVSTFCGTAGSAGLQNGSADSSLFNGPFGICRDKEGNLYVADGDNHCIRRIDKNGRSSIFAGTTVSGFKDTSRLHAQFNGLTNLCIDTLGNLYVSDFLNHRIRKIDTNGLVTTIAGSGIAGFKNDMDTAAQFNYPRGITLDKAGNLYIADSWNHRIRKINGDTYEVTTFAGGGVNMGVGSNGDLIDGPDTTARFHTPSGIAIDSAGNFYVADAFNHRIRKIATNGNVSSIVGAGSVGNGNGGFQDGNNAVALLNTPTDLMVLQDGSLLISDTYNNRIRKFDISNFQVSTFAGTGNAGHQDGADTAAQFDWPRGIVGNEREDSFWVVDHNNEVLRMLVAKQDTISNTALAAQTQYALSAWPNPSTDQLILDLPNEKAEIQLFDATGRIVLERSILGNTVLQLNHLPAGNYLINYRSSSRQERFKVIHR